jgi:hypothetical protein
MGLVVSLTRANKGTINLPRLAGTCLIAISFAYPLSASLPRALKAIENEPATQAADLAKLIEVSGLQGPIAGVGNCRRYHAQYVAFLLQHSHYGCDNDPTIEEVKASGASLLVVNRDYPLTEELDKDSAFSDLDYLLFGSEDQAVRSPLKV